MKIIPGPLTSDITELTKFITEAEGLVDRIQIDVVDGIFANNKTVDPSSISINNSGLAFDFHLMVKDPVSWIDKIPMKEGNRVIGQIEMMESQKEFVDVVSSKNMLVGLAVDLKTPIDKLDQEQLSKLDVVLLMSVEAGFGGQEFNLDVWEKIKKVDELRHQLNLNFKICIDGGVTQSLVSDMARSGVDEIVVGKRIFEPNLKDNLKLFAV